MVKTIFDKIEKTLMVILGTLLIVMVAVIFMQVLLRYCFKSATVWADEVARYCMIWIVFLASPIGFRRHSHINVDVVTSRLPERVRKALALLMYVLEIVFLLVLIYAAVQYIGSVGRIRSVGMEIDMRYMYSATIVGGVLMLMFAFECIYNEYLLPKKTKPTEENVV